MSRAADGLWLRNNSRVSRLARLRMTAPPILRVAAMPRRACPVTDGLTNTVISRPLTRVPDS